MAQMAYIDIGDNEKTDCMILKGQMPEEKEKIDCYWYEEDIAAEEFAAEVNDLLEFYETVVLGLPIPEYLMKKRDTNGNEVE